MKVCMWNSTGKCTNHKCSAYGVFIKQMHPYNHYLAQIGYIRTRRPLGPPSVRILGPSPPLPGISTILTSKLQNLEPVFELHIIDIIQYMPCWAPGFFCSMLYWGVIHIVVCNGVFQFQCLIVSIVWTNTPVLIHPFHRWWASGLLLIWSY